MMTFLWTAKKTNERNLKNVIAVRTACYQVLKQKCTVTFLDNDRLQQRPFNGL